MERVRSWSTKGGKAGSTKSRPTCGEGTQPTFTRAIYDIYCVWYGGGGGSCVLVCRGFGILVFFVFVLAAAGWARRFGGMLGLFWG